MERALFLVESTGARVSCLLNPEYVLMRRVAGVRARRSSGGKLSGQSGPDDPLLLTGGGRTEINLELLFDVDVEGTTIQTSDVRDLTGPLWNLTEGLGRSDQRATPPRLLFVWGKSWNVPVVAVSISERLERFSAGGVPRRSWVRVKLFRIPPAPEEQSSAGPGGALAGSAAGGAAPRPDLDAYRATSDAGRWREFVPEAGRALMRTET